MLTRSNATHKRSWRPYRPWHDLSFVEFAGRAGVERSDAEIDGDRDAFARAAAMPLAERRERWEAMMLPVERNDIPAWCAGFLDALQAEPSVPRRSASP